MVNCMASSCEAVGCLAWRRRSGLKTWESVARLACHDTQALPLSPHAAMGPHLAAFGGVLWWLQCS